MYRERLAMFRTTKLHIFVSPRVHEVSAAVCNNQNRQREFAGRGWVGGWEGWGVGVECVYKNDIISCC